MKKILLSILLFSASFSAFSQSTPGKSAVFIGLGPSLPVGQFGLKDATNEDAGMASVGFYLDLGYQYQFSKKVGAIAMFKGKIHGLSKDVLYNALPTVSGGSVSMEASTWKMGSILGGLSQRLPLVKSNAFAIEFREAAGVQFTSSPRMSFNFNLPEIGPFSAIQESQSASSFAYLLGVGFSYQINSHLGLKLYGDYNNSNVKFKDVTATIDGSTTIIASPHQRTGTIDVGLGLAIGL
jgi:opacity protein-like surface antigen